MRTYTPFESEVVDLAVWLLEGLKKGRTTERATNRILRATLRRIKPKLIGESLESRDSSANDIDHAVPMKVIVSKIHEGEYTKERIQSILDQFLVSVKLTKDEHTQVLKKAGLSKDMPADWDGVDPYSRYKKAGIKIKPNQSAHTTPASAPR
ncbi:hypothetical protein [Pelagicoccus sp. SDUM812003]|uniref:hypothetical protein n=1 Tax=Pelagicoccus sp. SDUM812003 TaxID=3041267 RepID=UPI00280F63F1|nr:hypothetical protein [Pelagicoccus sp. SDUM812003]MDQ8205722.1 hypothetical protein [Pelagicoccus sp. SDUM812003]